MFHFILTSYPFHFSRITQNFSFKLKCLYLSFILACFSFRSTHDDLLTNGLSVATAGTTDRTPTTCKGGKFRKALDVKIIDDRSLPEDEALTEENNFGNDTHEYCIKDFMSASPPLSFNKGKQNSTALGK